MENDGADDGTGGMLAKYQQYKARVRTELELSDVVVSSPSESDCD
jgi:hypothetical protein